ncbi:MAG: hypothetical protein JKX85_00740 [Phycisphaeraceae bacterium]|nr:hypothetical protein [Phycisphaeraceae bacterium]
MKTYRPSLKQVCNLLLSLTLFCSSSVAFADQKTPATDLDQGWVSSLQYAPDTGFIYSLGNMRDGKSIQVFHGVKSSSRKVITQGKKHKIKASWFTKSTQQQKKYNYQFKDIYTGTTLLSQKNTWEFTVKRKITAIENMKLEWWDNYLNSHLIAGRSFTGNRSSEPIIISKDDLPVGKMFEAAGKGKTFKKMSFDSAIGRIDLTFNVRMGLVDHRKAPWRGHDDSHLLYRSFNLKKGQSIDLSVHVKITPDFDKLKQYQPIASGKDIYTPKSPIASRHVIMPAPKQITWKKERFHLGLKANLFHHLQSDKIATQAKSFFADIFQINLQEKTLDKQWKNCLVLSNSKLPKTFKNELKQLQKKVATLTPPGSYALQITGDAILIAGKTEQGVWNGLMTLFQLSRHQVSTDGIDYDQVAIADYPDFDHRGFYVRIMSDLDVAWSRHYVAAMAELKYNQAILHFARGLGVRFNAQLGCYDASKPSLSVDEFAAFVRYIQSFNMQVVPLWAAGKTMLPEKHFEQYPKLANLTIKKGNNWDISLEETFAYHKSILDEIIKVTGVKTIHLGIDEIYHFALDCRNNTGNGGLILANYINKFTDYYAPQGIRTVIYHDMLVSHKEVSMDHGYFAANAHEGSEKALDLLRNRDMLTIENWSYSENKIYSEFDHFVAKGFNVYGSCWYRYENIIGLSAHTKGRSNTFASTYWSQPSNNPKRGWDPRGNMAINGPFKTYKFLPAIGLAGEVAWNAGNRNLPYNFLEETLRLFSQRKGLVLDDKKCVLVDLSQQANRDLADTVPGDDIGFIDKGRTTDLSAFPSGKQVLGGVPFLVTQNAKQQARAISVKGAYTNTLSQQVTIALKKDRYASLVFLHTCHFEGDKIDINQNLATHYIVTYEDATTQKIKLINDQNIMAWAPALTPFDADNQNLWLAWVGMTKDNLPTAVYGYHWENPWPQKAITSVQMQTGTHADESVFLIALTGIK